MRWIPTCEAFRPAHLSLGLLAPPSAVSSDDGLWTFRISSLAGTVLGMDENFFLNSFEIHFSVLFTQFQWQWDVVRNPRICDNVSLIGNGLREVTPNRQFSKPSSLLLFSAIQCHTNKKSYSQSYSQEGTHASGDLRVASIDGLHSHAIRTINFDTRYNDTLQ